MKIHLVIVALLMFLMVVVSSSYTIEVMNEEPPAPTPTPQPTSVPRLVQLIVDTAMRYEIDSKQFLETARCESGLKPDAVGDGGRSYGLFQIHLPAHPSVTKEQALDPTFAVEWSAKKFKVNPEMWTCYRNLYGNSDS